MSDYIPLRLRQTVGERAEQRCEYCRYPQIATFLSFEIEHIIARKHGGKSVTENLALACPHCNLHKGSDIASLDPQDGRLTALFHPRTQAWSTHFQLDGAIIKPLTAEGASPSAYCNSTTQTESPNVRC